jgi:hypothetical protein
MAFNSVRDVVRAWEEGRCWNSFIHKTSTPTPSALRWADMSMGAGIPIYNAYVGAQLEATALTGQKNQGVFTGPPMTADQKRYLVQVSLASPQTTNGPPYDYILADYLMFYPLIDGDSTDQQDMANDISLPRYSDGKGVKAFMVITTPMGTDGDVTIGYTDADGVDRSLTTRIGVSSTVGVITNGGAAGVTVTRALAPFIPIPQDGVRKINYVTNLSAMGGFYAICLCKPLTTLMQREALTMTEKCLVSQQTTMPRIYPGAYLNFLMFANNSGNPSTVRGQLDFITE